ncbi:AraC family transcriptional regulator [Actinorhabdospora filicis]|uniref:AraC family transcriptional regulator n=1 Tax=Actinorhabdospora filicis TaxID=1785913 RepID=A0A9W6SU76_9ACTN|nr:AraC family transcriptional regulator [Actinorhabdospora filicis]GLZ81917.1 AraC family transcriptional regulator [Actinorhabdospora filicis]
MDVLSDVIAVTRTGTPRSALVRWHAPWGQRFASVPGAAGFQVVLEGSCWLLRPDDAPLRLSAGDVVFFPQGGAHTLVDSLATRADDPPCDPGDPRPGDRYSTATVDPTGANGPPTTLLCGAYRLDPARGHPLLRGLPAVIHLPARVELLAIVKLLAAEIADPRHGSDAVRPPLLDILLLYILRAWFGSGPARDAVTGWAAALNDPPVAAALRAVHRDPAAPWTVASLAAQGALSRAPFARRFTELVGRPPLAYLTWWRMTTAAGHLRASDEPLRTVAAAVGYHSEFAFATAFKREFGIAPGRFRAGERGSSRAGTADLAAEIARD